MGKLSRYQNLERNVNQSGSILCGDKCIYMNFPSPPLFFVKTQCIVGSFEGKHFVNVSPLKLLYFSCKKDAA